VKIHLLGDAHNQAYVNTGGYEEFMESIEEFPYIDVNTIEPGTDVLKIGSETGLTFGKFMGLANHSFTENGIKYHVENAVTIQWIPGMPLSNCNS